MSAHTPRLEPLTLNQLSIEHARLIAAAPDLLSIALRWAALDGGAWNVQRRARERDELLADTRAAIAAAEGK